nr:CotH kinase family protein [Eubacterium sp.]
LFSIYNSYQDDDPSSNYFTTKNNIQFRNITPEYMSEDLTEWQKNHRNYIREYIQNVEDLIVDSEAIDQETHDQIANLLDLKSVADYYLVQEFSRNGDAYGTNSTYLYKPRSGKLCFGPLWDFDIAYGTLEENDDVNESYHSLNNTHMLWIDELRNKDPEFVSIINERWSVMKEALDRLTANGGQLSIMSEEIRASYIANRELWYKSYDYPFDPAENPDYRPDYDEIFDENINDFSRWLIARKNWINENISNFDKVFATVTYIVDEEVYHTDDHVYIDRYCNSPIKGPDKENYIFEGWYSEDGVSLSDYIINEDTSFYARYISYEDAIAPQAIYLSKTEDWVEVGSIYDKLWWATVYPDDATSSDISWKSNDESIAIVEGEGTVSAISEGTVTIQGSTYNGVTTELILHVYDPDKVEPVQPEGITVGEEEPVIIEVNETRQLEWNFIPADKPVLYEYANSFCNNDDTIILDQNHVVTGIAPGEATIEISAYYKDQTIISKTITVRVVEKKDSDDKKDADGKGSSGENKDSGKTNVSKKANTLKVKGKTLTISYKKLKKKSRTFARKKLITVSKAKGKVTYKKVGVSKVTNNKYGIKYFTDPNKQYGKKFSVNPKTGKITVKKGLRKGTYKLRIKVTAAGNSSYKSKTKTVTIKIKVK